MDPSALEMSKNIQIMQLEIIKINARVLAASAGDPTSDGECSVVFGPLGAAPACEYLDSCVSCVAGLVRGPPASTGRGESGAGHARLFAA